MAFPETLPLLRNSTPRLDSDTESQESEYADETAVRTHLTFVHTNVPVVYDNKYETATTETVVTYDAPLDQPKCYTDHVFESRAAMREAEAERRIRETTLEEAGFYFVDDKHLAFSDVERQSYSFSVEATGQMKEELERPQTTSYRCDYIHNSPFNGKAYKTADGSTHVVQNAVISSNDRSTDQIVVPRVLRDAETGEAVTYTGRPDSLKKAQEQARHIFRSEVVSSRKGLRDTGEKTSDDRPIYEMTYAVFSLTKASRITDPSEFDERSSLLRENRALHEIRTNLYDIDGHVVRFKPIHIHSSLNLFSELYKVLGKGLSGEDIERAINKKGYTELLAYARSIGKADDPLLTSLIALLSPENIGTLSTLDRLMLTNLLVKKCGLAEVVHCKSCIDRTSLGMAISLINHEIATGKISVRPDLPHAILSSPSYQRLFLAMLNGLHPASRASRMGEKENGEFTGRKELGLNVAGVPELARLLPKEAVKESSFWSCRLKVYAVTVLTGIAQILFATVLAPLYQTLAAIVSLAIISIYDENGRNLCEAIHMAPYQIKFWKIPQLDLLFTVNKQSTQMNKDDRHLIHETELSHPFAKAQVLARPTPRKIDA